MGTGPRTNRALAIASGVALALAVLVAAWIGLRIGGDRTALWVDDGSTPVAAGLACALCVRAALRDAGRMRLFWSLLALATGFWTVAEVLWGLYPLILDRAVPSVSVADAGYLLAVPVALAALCVHPAVRPDLRRPRGAAGRVSRDLFDGIVIATALLFLSWTFVLGPLWRTTDFSTAEGLIGLAYPFGDVVIVFFVVLAIRRITGGDRRSLWFLLAGLLAMALSDSAYAYLSAAGDYATASPHLIDAGWVTAYLAFGIAALSAGSAPVCARVSDAAGTPSVPSLLAPFAPVLIALTATAIEIRIGHHLDTAAWLMAFALVLLVLVRQGLMLLALRPPQRRLS